MKHVIHFSDLGRQPYKDVWDYQESLLEEKVKTKQLFLQENAATAEDLQSIPHDLLFTEHNPVYTLGKNGKENHMLLNKEMLAQRGIEYFQINRGGDITFHGPGQIVGYPILDLDQFKPDLGWYLRNLEEVIIRTIADYGLTGERSEGETGVWLDAGIKGKARKICAMGIRCSRWITMHGFALNVNTDLNYFNFIVPCGIQDKTVTSLQHELGREVPVEEVKEKLLRNFEIVFEASIAVKEHTAPVAQALQ